jgi:superfamily II DNA/RNA helicase
VGRTARANNDGLAITFVNDDQQTEFKKIEDFIGKDIYKIPVPIELGETPAYHPKKKARHSVSKKTFKRKKTSK